MNEQQIFLAFVLGTTLLTALTLSLGLFLFAHKKKQARNQLEKQQLEFAYQTELLRARLEEQEKSMTLLSEEIHDNIGQVLGLAKMYLYRITGLVQDPETAGYGNVAMELLSNAINDLRHISHSLNGELLSRSGLENALEREITYLQETTEMRCLFSIEGNPFDLRKERNILVFRIVQEALQNAVKHSGARTITLMLDYLQEELSIEITDDGRGFEVSKAQESNSLGIRNIQNRANLLNAGLSLRSEAGQGTRLELRIPRNEYHEK